MIHKSISVNVAKVHGSWVVELFFAGHESVWIARDKNKNMALRTAYRKLRKVTMKIMNEANTEDKGK